MKIFNTPFILLAIILFFPLVSCESEKDRNAEKSMEESFQKQSYIEEQLSKTESGKIYLDLLHADDELTTAVSDSENGSVQDYWDKTSDIDDKIDSLCSVIDDKIGKDKKDYKELSLLFLKKAEIANKYGFNASGIESKAKELAKSNQ